MIAIIDYKAGNTLSVSNAVKRLGYDCLITHDHDQIRQADKVILPGVGEASHAMENLKTRNLDEIIPGLKQPVLGICLGMQLLCQSSAEGNVDCLGLFDCKVLEFPPLEKVPHMGWNEIDQLKATLFIDVEDRSDVYFVHSYYAEICAETVARCNYISEFSAALQRDNFQGVQFHPEKSGSIGERILSNFLKS